MARLMAGNCDRGDGASLVVLLGEMQVVVTGVKVVTEVSRDVADPNGRGAILVEHATGDLGARRTE